VTNNRHAPPRRQVRRAKQLTALSLTTASPVLGAPALGQVHRLEAIPLETAPLSSPEELVEQAHHFLKPKGIGQPPAKRPGRRSHTETEVIRAIAKRKIWVSELGRKPKQSDSIDFFKTLLGPGARKVARRAHHESGLRSKRPK
jgi:hypothetical protein